jgi:hypothetical protein
MVLDSQVATRWCRKDLVQPPNLKSYPELRWVRCVKKDVRKKGIVAVLGVTAMSTLCLGSPPQPTTKELISNVVAGTQFLLWHMVKIFKPENPGWYVFPPFPKPYRSELQ